MVTKNINISHFAIMTKEILTYSVSTVVVERAFRTKENTLDEKRSSLRSKNLEAQYLVNDWSKITSQIQLIKSDEEDQDDTDGTSKTTTKGHVTSKPKMKGYDCECD